MLKELTIENLAVIEYAVVTFEAGLNVFSGETGAGKSVLIGGINAALGGRVTRDIVRNGADKAVVTALFDDVPRAVATALEQAGYTCAADELLLTREISADGKSVARVNGRTITAGLLKDIARHLLDIHGQRDTVFLTDAKNQLALLDADCAAQIEEYAKAFFEFSQAARNERRAAKAAAGREAREKELERILAELSEFDFCADELSELAKKIGEFERQEDEVAAAARVKHALSGGGEHIAGAVELLGFAQSELSALGGDYAALAARLSSACAEVTDVSAAVSAATPYNFSAGEATKLRAKYDFLKFATKKYACTDGELAAKKKEWQSELNFLHNFENESAEMAATKHKAGEELKRAGANLTSARVAAAKTLSARLKQELAFLDMESAEIIFDIRPGKVTKSGVDEVNMLVATNRGEPPKDIAKTASGGELSRIMLAVKSVMAGDVPTMIFDEIDTGISGRAARKVGVKLRKIAARRQVLCVTHLAQIAAAAGVHFVIQKTSDSERVRTCITKLDENGRRREIARIISGDERAPASLDNAGELISMMTGEGE